MSIPNSLQHEFDDGWIATYRQNEITSEYEVVVWEPFTTSNGVKFRSEHKVLTGLTLMQAYLAYKMILLVLERKD